MAEETVLASPSAAPVRSKEAPKTRWSKHATRVLKVAMLEADIGFKKLADLLNKDDPGAEESAETLTKRINRGNFTFAFGLRVLRVLDIPSVDLSRIQTDAQFREAQEEKQKLPGAKASQ